ncbi:MAG: hypothetical protein KBT03_07535 [Bacteroidales bacterium]|nr:hypothetical protein [Candidatus Scybalousia scybalohippi]
MASKTPQFNIKTGADSELYIQREITVSDVDEKGNNYNPDSDDLGKIKERDMSNGADLYEYPVLIRRTGDSLKGSTESIESNELRKGRTKSAPRKGSSSSEGSIDFELSAETYDDILEATLRDTWSEWQGDSKSKINLDNLDCKEDKIFTKAGDQLHGIGDRNKNAQKRLVGSSDYARKIREEAEKTETYKNNPEQHPDYPLIVTDASQIEVHELSCGKKDIRYSILKHFGGVEGDDLYQEFEHCAVNSMSLSVTPGQIVTGSFSFMGANNPELQENGEIGWTKVTTEDTFDENVVYFTKTKDGKYKEFEIKNAGAFATAVATDNLWIDTKERASELVGKLSKNAENISRFKISKTPQQVQEWINNLPDKGTSTDQYTAREGFLYVNGERVRYGSTLSFEMDNGLNKTFAIFEKDSIALSPLSLNISGTFGAYLIGRYTEKLHNLMTQDKDVEMLFTFQDKEDDPEALYLVQIPKTKFTDADISSGAENLEDSFPFSSFEEQGFRILRLRKRRPYIYAFDPKGIKDMKVEGENGSHTVVAHVRLSTNPNKYKQEDGTFFNIDENDFEVKITHDGEEVIPTHLYYNKEKAELFIGFDAPDEVNVFLPKEKEQKITLTVKYNGIEVSKTVVIDGDEGDNEIQRTPEYTFIESFADVGNGRVFIKNSKDDFTDMSDVTKLVNESSVFLAEGGDWRNVFYKLADTNPDTSIVIRNTESPKEVKFIYTKVDTTKETFDENKEYYTGTPNADSIPVEITEFEDGTTYYTRDVPYEDPDASLTDDDMEKATAYDVDTVYYTREEVGGVGKYHKVVAGTVTEDTDFDVDIFYIKK